MFGMSGVEIGILFVLALLLLGPQKLPELARSVGKGIRDFKKATDGIRASVEDEFYNLDKPPAPELRTVTMHRGAAPQLDSTATPAAATDTASAPSTDAPELEVVGANQVPAPPPELTAAPEAAPQPESAPSPETTSADAPSGREPEGKR